MRLRWPVDIRNALFIYRMFRGLLCIVLSSMKHAIFNLWWLESTWLSIW